MTPRRPVRAADAQAGFTLVELMISLVIFSFAVAGVLSLAVTMTQGYREQRSAVATEMSVRVPLDLLADAIRQASPAVSDPAAIQDANTCDATGAIVVTNSGSGPDQLELVYASGGIVTSTRDVFHDGTTSIELTDANQLRAGDYILVSDFKTGHLIKLTGVSGNTVSYASPCGSFSYPEGSVVVRAQRARFTIEDLDGVPTLMMDPDASGPEPAEPLAEGIEDMQIAVGVDANNVNGIEEVGNAADDDEWHYNVASETAPTGNIRAVRITLVGRALQPLAGDTKSFALPAAEDRPQGAADSYRRRVLRTIVEVRNVGGSP